MTTLAKTRRPTFRPLLALLVFLGISAARADLVAEWDANRGYSALGWDDQVAAFDLVKHRFAPLSSLNATPKTPTSTRALSFDVDSALLNTAAGGPLDGATEFTVAVVFKPNGNGESVAGTNFWQKSQLVNADTPGTGHDWGLGYADGSIWFGVGDARTLDSPTLQRDGSSLRGDWRIAVCTWAGDFLATGEPRMGAWIFGADLAPVGDFFLDVDPNAVAGTSNLFNLPRDSEGGARKGICVGGERGSPNARNFDGNIAGIQLYSHACLDARQAKGIALVMAARHLSADRTVTNTNDSGPGSLRDALLNNPPDLLRVLFAPGLNRKTITLTSGSLVLGDFFEGPAARCRPRRLQSPRRDHGERRV